MYHNQPWGTQEICFAILQWTESVLIGTGERSRKRNGTKLTQIDYREDSLLRTFGFRA
jgi:hypothetical protein